jgi:cysteine synthase
MARVRGITELIGGTPLLRLNRISDESGAEVYGKLESFNPGGSVERYRSTTLFGGQA